MPGCASVQPASPSSPAEIAPEPAPGDQVIEEGGARVFVNSEAAQILDNAELDAHMEGDQVAFGVTPASSNNSSSAG